MSPTIKDVAKLANVSASTVSRVIANNPKITAKTKQIVNEAMKELGYHPNYTARSLANKNTQTIGLVMPSSGDKVFQNPFFPEVIRGISTKAHEYRYGLYMTTGNTEEEIFEGVVSLVQGRRVDGLILLYSRMDDRMMNYLQEQNFPFSVIGKPYKDEEKITFVDNDNFKAAQGLTNHLIELGHERIGFIGGGLDLVVTVDRLLGYEKAIRKAGLIYRDDFIVHHEFLREGGQHAVHELMSLDQPPTGLVITDDVMAFGVLNAVSEVGIRVPDDLSVVSFNNVALAEMSTPSLTSVDINIFQLGYEAMECLLHRIQHPDLNPKRVVIGHKIIKRNSSTAIEKAIGH